MTMSFSITEIVSFFRTAMTSVELPNDSESVMSRLNANGRWLISTDGKLLMQCYTLSFV